MHVVMASPPPRYSPLRQSLQPLVKEFTILPAAQSLHLVLPESDVRPAAHGVQGTVRLFSMEKESFWQSVQLVAPTKSLNSP